MFDSSGWRPLEAASETTHVWAPRWLCRYGHSTHSRSAAPEHFPTLSLQVGRLYLHVAAGAIFNKLQRSPRACPLKKERMQ